jgi:hypothetical protein
MFFKNTSKVRSGIALIVTIVNMPLPVTEIDDAKITLIHFYIQNSIYMVLPLNRYSFLIHDHNGIAFNLLSFSEIIA